MSIKAERYKDVEKVEINTKLSLEDIIPISPHVMLDY